MGQSASSTDDSLVVSVTPEPHFGHGWGFGTGLHATPEVPARQGPVRRGARDTKLSETDSRLLASMRLIVARCEVSYSGRLNAFLPDSTRLLMLKDDGSVLVHADAGGYKPLNYGR